MHFYSILCGQKTKIQNLMRINPFNVRRGEHMTIALFINGIYKGVLEEILNSQKSRNGGVSYLQPYKGEVIKILKKQQPTILTPIRLYISTTDNLSQICYTADIIGWEDKRECSEARRNEVYRHLETFQPGEAGYFKNFDKNENKAFNLISIQNLYQLDTFHSTNILRKISDGMPLKKRTRAGGWSPVYDLDDLIVLQSETQENLNSDLNEGIAKSMTLSDDALRERLASAPKMPPKVQVVSIGHKRNPDVIVAVLRRANGICEKCSSQAPFFRRSDGSPYLEVHHWVPLSQDGKDTIDNAVALCPNCHREMHHGQICCEQIIQAERTQPRPLNS